MPSLLSSTDGALICLHDETLDHTTEGRGPVVELRFALIAAHSESEGSCAVDMKADDEAVEIDVVRLARQHAILDRLLLIGRTIDRRRKAA